MKYKAEYVYAVAANMDRGGRMSSEIYHRGNELLIFNMDRTLISRWLVTDELPGELKFFAGDYEEGCKIEARGESITFSREATDYEWSKCSRVPVMNFAEVAGIFEKFASKWLPESLPSITLDDDILRFLDERLRHTEFRVEGGQFEMVQKDIYTGETKATRATGQGGLLVGRPNVENLATRAMRTVDFQSLFLLAKQFDLYFSEEYTYARSADNAVEVLIANCLYDEMSDVNMLGGELVPEEIQDVVKEVAEGGAVLGLDLAVVTANDYDEMKDRTHAEFDALMKSVEGYELPVDSNQIPEHYGLGLTDYQEDWKAFYAKRFEEISDAEQISAEYIVIWSLFQMRDKLREIEASRPEPEEIPQRVERRKRSGRKEPEGTEGEPESDQQIEGTEEPGDGPEPAGDGAGLEEAPPVRRRRG